MNYRRLGLLVGLAAFAALGPLWAVAQGTGSIEPITVYQSEGRDPIPFNVTCATAAWSVVVSSDSIARSTVMEAVPSNTQTVCIKSYAGSLPTIAVSSQCVSATLGPQLPPASSYTDYSKSAWACIASSGTTSQTISGERTRDRGDYGNIGNARGY